MIRIVFVEKDGRLNGFSVSGHAGYAPYGSDIVCSAVTSAVQLTVNDITEICKAEADVETLENEIKFKLADNDTEKREISRAFLESLKLHVEILSEKYKGTIKIEEITGGAINA